MARQQVDIGVEGNDGTGNSIRESFRKVNENFQEIYAVFGIGGQISFTNLSDTPNTYENNENKVPVVKYDGSGIDFLELASDNSLNSSVDTIGFDFSVDGKLIIRQLVSKLSNDPQPILSGPLNAATQPIAGVTVTQAAVDTFNSTYNTDYTISDLVINKSYADRNYQGKEIAGKGLRLASEITDASIYTFTAIGLELGNLNVPGHGFESAFNGTEFIFNTTGTAPFGVTDGESVYVHIVDNDTIALHNTEQDALDATGRIMLSGGTGVFTISDAAYDATLPGNWLKSLAMPREAIVRRQGDNMEGLLNLSDHPGDLAGIGLPNGPDDLQAVTKLYVDNASSISTVNLFVSTAGNDKQTFTPVGKEGRSQAYAYKTIGAAAEKAEEIIAAAPYEPGPYLQTLTYNTGAGEGTVITAGIASPISGRTDARTLIIQNKEFVAKEVTAYLDTLYPSAVGTYNIDTCHRDLGLMLEAVSLDALLGNNANYLSRWAGMRYFTNVSSRKAIGAQRQYTIAGINYAKLLITQYILTNTAPTTLYQSRVTQYINANIVADVIADNAIGAKFDIILQVITDGVLNAPEIVDGQTNYKINIANGNYGFIDQASPANTDLIPGKVIRGKSSGAIGKVIDYKYESGPRAVSVIESDEVEIQLLKPIEFLPGEVLEFGNIVRETQIVVQVETGIYYEDYPLRVPANVSIRGDEFRRVLIRPKNRVSQSRYANVYFYRDAEFDGMVLGNSAINTLSVLSSAETVRTAGTYTISSAKWTSDNKGTDAEFIITVSPSGAITNVNVSKAGKNFIHNEVITIDDSDLGNGGANSVLLSITSVPNGIKYVNPLTGVVDGYFGNHYLLNPNKLKNTGPGYSNVGDWQSTALTLSDNKEFIQEQVVEYISSTYPVLFSVYSKAQSREEVGIIVDALVQDLQVGGNEFSLEAQGEYYLGAQVAAGSLSTETISGLQYISTIANRLIRGLEPITSYGVTNDHTADLFNGDSDPITWTAGTTYYIRDLVKFTLVGVDRYYTPTIEHIAGSVFNAAEVLEFWREIDGPETIISNLIDTVAFSFTEDYNPALRNENMDAFLMNDATIVRNVTVQGHGGFMLVLDPEGQVLTKSPYIQTGSSFSASKNKQAFRGGMFVDAFVGNSAVQITERVGGSAFRLKIQSLGSQAEPQGLFVRRPQTPCVFYIDGRRFQVNAISNYDKDFGVAELILDPSSNGGDGFAGTTSQLITGIDLDSTGLTEFDNEKCDRDSRIILEGVGNDVALGTNYNSVYNGLAYLRGSAGFVISDQLTVTTTALAVGRDEVLALPSVASVPGIVTSAAAAVNEVIDIITNGEGVANTIVWTYPGTDSLALFSRLLLQLNRTLISTSVTDWITATYPAHTYDIALFQRDIVYAVDAISYDIQYGGNSASITTAKAYFDDAVSILPTAQKAITAAAFGELANIVSAIVEETFAGQAATGNPAGATKAAAVAALSDIIRTAVSEDSLNSLPIRVTPDVTWATTDLQDARDQINKTTSLIAHRIVQSVDAPIAVTLQTAGNRAMLGNDFTQVNDLGYGTVAVNGALCELVSMFTYYCWASYYAKNGSQIRSVTGSSCYGEYGLVAEGSDPNEIPDKIILTEDMVQPAKAFSTEAILYLTGPVELEAGDVVEQATTLASGSVVIDTSLASNGGSGSVVIYLKDTSGAFDTTNELAIVDSGSPDVALGSDSVPYKVDNTGYRNSEQNLSMYVYDMADVPSNRSELDVYHASIPAFARYEVANVELAEAKVGSYINVGTSIAYTFVAGVDATTLEANAIFTVSKTINNGYGVTIQNEGDNYAIADSFVVDGSLLGGVTSTHDCTIIVTAVESGTITAVTATGTIFVETTTPTVSNNVYKLNFSTSDAQFSANGLLNDVPFATLIEYRRNQTHLVSDLARPEKLQVRPSTAVLFDENPQFVYRSISFLTSDSIGTELPVGTLQVGFDTGYDYIRLLVDSAKAQEVNLSGTGTTKGGTAGDSRIALLPVADMNEIFRLNNNLLTPEASRPLGWSNNTLVSAPIIVWQGKKHYVYNYRGVANISSVETEVLAAEDNLYAIVDILDTGETINQTNATGLHSPVVLGNQLVTVRAGLQASAGGDVTINISTCRATGHDFLDVGTGGFNRSNYPNVIYGEAPERDDTNEIAERGKGRVFYVSTDQNGVFRVGKYFSVDQGTGTVTFSASIALSDVDGLGFKRGVVVTEFSTDTAMTDNASDTVPTELAVRGYVNRRLGFDVNGNPVANKIGAGVLAPNGAVPMTGDLNASGNTITNLSTPNSSSDAATKAYVDNTRGVTDEIKDLRSVEYNAAEYDQGQFLVSTGYKKLIILASTIVSGPFTLGQTISGSNTGATGTIVDIIEQTGTIDGDVIVLIYAPVSGVFSDGIPAAGGVDTITGGGITQGLLVDGPVDEWANGIWNAASDIVVTTNRNSTDGFVDNRSTSINLQIKTNTIINADVNATANISQSKLALTAAGTRANSTAISQADLGVAAFDAASFNSDAGWITVLNNGITLGKLTQIPDSHVLGRIGGSAGNVAAVPFATIISQGGGVNDSDFQLSGEIAVGDDAGYALIRTSIDGAYGVANVSATGEDNSLVKTDTNGSIQVNSLILGSNASNEVLSIDGAALVIKTPGQGEILRATGGTGGGSPTFPVIEMAGSLDISNTGVSQSTLKASSSFAGEKALAVDWIYSSFIEAAGERSSASTGVSIGAGTGFTNVGEVGVVVANSVANSSVAPAIFSVLGFIPDTTDAYDIGSVTNKYATVHATLFQGTATEAYYADLAENYLADEYYDPGTVLVFGGEQEVTESTSKCSFRVAGVVSTNPAHLMNAELTGEHVTALALTGRVPCKVLGTVKKGDMLVSSGIPGYAVVDNEPRVGSVIGKSLQNKTNTSRGIIEVVVGKH